MTEVNAKNIVKLLSVMCLKEVSGDYESTVERSRGKQIYSVH